MPLRVEFPVREEWPDAQPRRVTFQQPVADHGAIAALLHEDPLLDDASAHLPGEDRHQPVEPDLGQGTEPIRVDGPVPVFLRGERLRILAVAKEPILGGGQQHHALSGRM